MASEADIIARESGGNPYVGYGGVDLSKAPRDKYGFPIWEGRMGPDGISHAAGLHQWEPKTWAEAAQALGLKDFSEASQHQAFDYMHAKYGDKPWAASAPLKPGEHRWMGAPQQTGDGLYLGMIEKAAGQEPPPGIFLDALLKSSEAKDSLPALEPPGGKFLDGLLQAPQSAGTPAAATTLPAVPPPQRVAPPQGGIGQVQIDPITQKVGGNFLDGLINGASSGLAERVSGAPPATRGVPGTRDNPLIQPGEGGAPIGARDIPGSEDKNRFWNDNNIAPYSAPGVPDDRMHEAAVGSDVLDRLLTTAGAVPSRETDIQQAEREQQPAEPFIDLPGRPSRVQTMADLVTPYLAGGAPGGSTSAGMRLPARRGGVPARVEPPPLAEGADIALRGAEVAAPEPEMRLAPGGGAGGGQPPIWRGGGAETAPEREPRPNRSGESPAMVRHRLGAMRQTQDRLFQLWEQSEEYRNRVLTGFEDMPSLTAEEKLQVERYLEWQPGMPQVEAPSSAAMRMIDEVIKPAQRQAAADLAWLKSEGVVDNLSEEQLEEMTTGYLHRLASNKSGTKFAPFAGVRSLRQRTSAMRGRQTYVLQYEDGERVLRQGDPPGPYGSTTATNRGTAEVRRATTQEVEGQTDIRYLHDPVLATLQNMTELHLARRNAEALKGEILPSLIDEGLATADTEAGIRLGFKQSKVPALRGHWFEERLANAFDDFYQTPQALHGDLSKALSWVGNANRFAIASMFINPLGHMRNVTGDAILARGDLWFSPRAYVTGTQDMRAAFNDVRNLSDFYRDVMKAGGPLKNIGVGNRVAYESLLRKAQQEMTTLPHMDQLARSTGVWQNAKQMADAIWNVGQKFMWGFHDMLYLQRVRELMRRGRHLPTAVQEAQRFIAGYRVPASVGEGGVLRIPKPIARGLSVLNQDHTLTAFGRYRYDKVKAIANVLRDAGKAIGNRLPPEQKKEALARLGTMLLWSTALQYGINFALQQATGNPEARAHVPGAMGIPANAARVASDLYKRDFGEAGWDFAMGMASIISPLPVISEAIGQLTNTNFPVSSSPIRGHELPGWEQWLQSGAHAAEEMVPAVSDIARMYEGKGIGSLGISLPDPQAVAAAKAPHPREYRSQQRGFYREFPWLQP